MDQVLDPVTLDSLRQLTPPGEPDVLTEVLHLFLQEVPGRIEKLRIAWAAGNIQDVMRAAHSLKGSAGNIGAKRMHAICKQLDDTARSADRAEVASLVDALGLEFGNVEEEIRRLLAAGS